MPWQRIMIYQGPDPTGRPLYPPNCMGPLRTHFGDVRSRILYTRGDEVYTNTHVRRSDPVYNYRTSSYIFKPGSSTSLCLPPAQELSECGGRCSLLHPLVKGVLYIPQELVGRHYPPAPQQPSVHAQYDVILGAISHLMGGMGCSHSMMGCSPPILTPPACCGMLGSTLKQLYTNTFPFSEYV